MSLLLWLPLVRDLTNQGLLSNTITNNNATLNDNGKLGKCYSFNSNASVSTQIDMSQIGNEFSFCGWVYFTSTTSAQYIFHLGGGTSWQSKYALSEDYSGTIVYYINGTENRTTLSTATSLNTWVHYAYTYDGSTVSIYVNGELAFSVSKSVTSFTPTNNVVFGARADNTAGTTFKYGMQNGRLCDLRIYNSCISPKEIKEISKGLVCHYQLNDVYSTNNLIPNGYGQDGSKGWSNSGSSYMSTTEIPPNQPSIKASYYSYNTSDYIPVVHNTTYAFSLYLKATGTSGTVYPSFRTYDIDKLEILCFHCGEGFNATYKTTLAQPLHKGDTVVYATDLSAWTTADNYYNYCAIFGYKDSQGTVYPDMGYTHDSPQFASKGSTKTNIDKTNNTITLNAPYTGEDRPAGTTICQATAGGTYDYPFGGINVTTITDWTLKSTTVNPDTRKRWMYARYVRYLAYPNAYHAGIKLTDNSNTPKVYDCSGYGYDGVVNGDLISSLDTPRLRRSTKFDGTTSYVSITGLPTGDLYTFSWWGKFTNTTNKMMWGFYNGNRLNLYMTSGNLFCWNTGDGPSNPFSGVTPSIYADNNWHHFCVTSDGTTIKLYIDGEFKANAKTFKAITGTTLILNGWDLSTNYKFNGQLSDLRIYATPLSADDVKALYEAPESISNTGAMFTQGEYVEL